MIDTQAILLFPHNGNALEAMDCLGDLWHCVGIVDDAIEAVGGDVNGTPVLDRSAFNRWPNAKILAVPGGPGSYRGRRALIESLDIRDERFAQVVHPTASISTRVKIGHNTLIQAGVVLTSNAIVGNHCCILPNTVVHHDSVIGDWTLVGANVTVCGSCRVGDNCYIGAASSLMNGLVIGDGAMIGFGSNVIRHVASESCVVGNPARVLERSERPSNSEIGNK